MTTEKLFVLVREDLPPGARISQAIHATDAFRDAHPEIHEKWHRESNTLAILLVRDVEHLLALKERAEVREISLAIFEEPDIAWQPTAMVLAPGPSSRNLIAKLPLAE